MKKYFALTLVAASVALAGCQKEEATQAPAEANAVVLETTAQEQAYAIGASVAGYISRNLEQQESMGLSLDKAFVLKGMEDALKGQELMSEEKMQTTLQGLDQQLNELAEKKAKEDAEKAKAESEKFFSDNAAREGVSVTESGLQYEVLTAAEGDKPSETDTVTVHYTGTLVDGTVFDSSVERGEPVSFPLNRVIPGWTEGVQLMPVGSKYKFYIPSELGYGEQGAGTIPANATLIFEVELISIEKDA